MSTESILTNDEINAMMDAAKDLRESTNPLGSTSHELDIPNQYQVKSFIDQLIVEMTKSFLAFLKKKPGIEPKSTQRIALNDILPTLQQQKLVYSIFKLTQSNQYSIVCMELSLLHQIINVLYGGKLNAQDTIIDQPGGIGLLVTNKLSELCMESLIKSYAEFGNLAYQSIKSTGLSNFSPYIDLKDEYHHVAFTLTYDDIVTQISFIIPTPILDALCPTPSTTLTADDLAIWGTTIKKNIIDASITLSAQLAPIELNIRDVMKLKIGDEIAISDPTDAIICVNNKPLYKAQVGKSETKRVAKIREHL